MTYFYRLPATFIVMCIALPGCNGEAPVEKHEGQAPEIAAPSSSHAISRNEPPSAPASIGFNYASENVRLQALGIPSSSTTARYRALPDITLESLAKAGDKMAKTFWVERLADQALTLQQSRDADGHFPEGIEEKDAVGSIGQTAYHLGALMQDPTNAMAGYLWGLHKSAATYGGPLEPVVAGIRLAGLRGDDRAIEIEREFREAHPNLDEPDIEMYFESGKRQMESAAVPRS